MTRPQLSQNEIRSLSDFARVLQALGEFAALMGDTLKADATSEPVRLALLDAMADAKAEQVPDSWSTALNSLLNRGSETVRIETTRTIRALRLKTLDDPLTAISRDNTQTDRLRFEALRTLIPRHAQLTPEQYEFVLYQLERRRDPAKRLAAADLLSGSELDGYQLRRFAEAAHGDPMIAPAAILAAARKTKDMSSAAAALVSFLRESIHSGWQLSREQLKWLESAVSESERSSIAKLMRDAEEASAKQRQLLAELEPLLQSGNPPRGQRVFEKAGCAVCHRIGPQGGMVGPDLTRIGAVRAARDLLEAVVMPSATFAQGYETYTVTTRDGESVTGIRVRDPDDSIVVRDASGAEMRFQHDQIAGIDQQKLSLMPEGLLSSLTPDEIRDLFAFLQSLK